MSESVEKASEVVIFCTGPLAPPEPVRRPGLDGSDLGEDSSSSSFSGVIGLFLCPEALPALLLLLLPPSSSSSASGSELALVPCVARLLCPADEEEVVVAADLTCSEAEVLDVVVVCDSIED